MTVRSPIMIHHLSVIPGKIESRTHHPGKPEFFNRIGPKQTNRPRPGHHKIRAHPCSREAASVFIRVAAGFVPAH
ncbi:hypothetical protein [Magnetospirillum gryphiswaldense]|uniref:hypothetical protein n=1 Tax=Magnetospirillum gryphiswaldense TaxID=55518 RepID=UPI0018F89B14|nr:hypothetical protein [Magnetospirillum gryphiswaldense]